jgi:predicted branched-subunit amino acid permease
MAPMLLAYAPFGLLVGAAVGASANPVAAWLGTFLIYGGAAHLTVLELLRQGSGWAAAATVGLLVNVRLSAYATAMAPQWRSASAGERAVAAVMLTDAPWAISHGRGSRRFYLGAALTLWVAWPVLVTLGVLVGGRLSAVSVADLLPALTLAVVMVGQLRHRPALAAVAAASGVAVLTRGLPPGLALLLAAAAGSLVGVVTERRS